MCARVESMGQQEPVLRRTAGLGATSVGQSNLSLLSFSFITGSLHHHHEQHASIFLSAHNHTSRPKVGDQGRRDSSSLIKISCSTERRPAQVLLVHA